MKKPFRILLRSLSILVGLLFVVAPFIAKDNDLLSTLLMASLGLVFVAYGLSDVSAPPNIPLRLHLPFEASIAFFFLVSGVNFLAKSEQRVLNRFAGAVLLCIVAASVWSAYARRRSPPAA